MVAFDQMLFCVFQAQPEVEPQLHFALFDLQKNDKICGCLPISPHSTLRWIGFSAEEQPLTLDSGGVLRAMLSTSSKSWIPVAEVGHECKLTQIANLLRFRDSFQCRVNTQFINPC